MHPSQTRETAFNKDEGKHGQREILERRDIRQVLNKRRVEVQSQNRDLLIRDVVCMSCTRGAFHSHDERTCTPNRTGSAQPGTRGTSSWAGSQP